MLGALAQVTGLGASALAPVAWRPPPPGCV